MPRKLQSCIDNDGKDSLAAVTYFWILYKIREVSLGSAYHLAHSFYLLNTAGCVSSTSYFHWFIEL